MFQNQNQNRYMNPAQLGVRPTTQLSVGFLSQAFSWMFVGLSLTAVVAWFVSQSAALSAMAQGLFLPVIIGQFILVIAISAGINKMGATTALGLFLVYAATMGVTLSFIFLAYELGSIYVAFFSAAAMFGGAALYGAVTKRNLASIGGYLTMGLIGIIAASILNMLIFQSLGLNFAISILGVAIFVGLTAWDVQKISTGQLAVATGSMEKGAVIGALHLYLDFINLFLFMLRLFGSRR
jgi:FtsH-binding integral membrane protein